LQQDSVERSNFVFLCPGSERRKLMRGTSRKRRDKEEAEKGWEIKSNGVEGDS
jgi:hypothetical protein